MGNYEIEETLYFKMHRNPYCNFSLNYLNSSAFSLDTANNIKFIISLLNYNF